MGEKRKAFTVEALKGAQREDNGAGTGDRGTEDTEVARTMGSGMVVVERRREVL